MTPITDFSRRSFAALALNQLLHALASEGRDPSILGEKAADGSTPIREIAKLADDLWVGSAAVGDPQVAFIKQALAGISEPSETVIALLAQALQATKEQVAEVVSSRIGVGEAVSRSDFEALNRTVLAKRKDLNPAETEALASLHQTLSKLGIDSVSRLAQEFVERYAELTGVHVLYDAGRNDAVLFRDHGEHILQHLRRGVRLTVFDEPGGVLSKGEQAEAEKLVGEVLQSLKKSNRLDEVSILGSFNDVGASGVLYRAAASFPEVARDGLMSADGICRPLSQVDHGTIIGSTSDDSRPLLTDLARGGCAFAVEPTTDAALKELQVHGRRGGVAIVLSGLTRAPDPQVLAQLRASPGVLVLDLSRRGSRLSSPAEGTRRQLSAQAWRQEVVEQAATYILARANSRNANTRGVAEFLSISEAPTEMNDIRAWAKTETTKYRLLRLLNALSNQLTTAHPEATDAQRRTWSYEFADTLLARTHGIDNFKENGAWQEAARAAVRESAPEIQQLEKALGPDILFASWFGIRDFDEKPLYFDRETSKVQLPASIEKLSAIDPHTLNAPEYAEIRLDRFTSRFLSAKDSKPEVFLGSREEMQLYYGSKGFLFDATTHDSNGTEYHLFRHPDAKRPAVMVIQGVDSEARLEHVAALMKVNGADPSRLIVRGRMDRVREVNRSQLTQRLAELQGPEGRQIAGVIIGNRNDPLAALRETLGPEAQLDVTAHEAGPFKFNAVRVKTSKDGPEQLLLAFAPAYGQLSDDLVQACAEIGARNFMLSGAGGSLNRHLQEARPEVPLDQLNDLHLIEDVVYQGRRIALDPKRSDGAESSPFLRALDLDPELKAKPATNYFSFSPVEQSIGWRDEVLDQLHAIKASGGDTDQETGPVAAALLRASRKLNGLDPVTGKRDPALPLPNAPVELAIQATLVQTQTRFDGKGELAAGTAGAGAAAPARGAARSFFKSIGISEVALKGQFVSLASGAKSQKVPAPAPAPLVANDASSVLASLQNSGRIPNYASIITASWMDSDLQLKGEKRPFIFQSASPLSQEVAQRMRTVLGSVNPSQAWVVLDASSAGVDRMREIATERGFEPILVGTKEEVKNLRGAYAFKMVYDTDEQKRALLEKLMKPDNQLEDPIFALSHHFVLDGAEPAGQGPGYHAVGGPEGSLERVVSEVRSEVNRAYEGGLTDYGDGTTYRYPGMRQAISERWERLAERGVKLPTGFDGKTMKAPSFSMPEDLSSLLRIDEQHSRHLYMVDGASLATWPSMDATSQARIQMLAKVLARLLARVKDQVAVGMGLTAHGVEGVFQQELHAAGVPIIGLATENMKVFNPDVTAEEEAKIRADYKLKKEDPLYEISDQVGHIVFGFGASWAGTPRLRLDQIFLNPSFESTAWAFGGGGVLGDMIGLQLGFNVDTVLFGNLSPAEAALEAARVKKAKKAAAKAEKQALARGEVPDPQALLDEALKTTTLGMAERDLVAGASVAMAKQYPTHAVQNLESFCARDPILGPELLKLKKELGVKGPVDTDESLGRLVARFEAKAHT